ncbi:hypothetical protein GUJ93_ZPchr0001g33188 [Zizania palustris]|uniref:Stomatal closure-related actin-binding protein coiled-coil domain-containing protein n=2 Tax=Zizania palustris TaxID=103762 RepID=A0A8J5VE20_ZIZPA|nr:hypothetical protein GUJ93_ZPchr0001g33188 [Zizania palustris]
MPSPTSSVPPSNPPHVVYARFGHPSTPARRPVETPSPSAAPPVVNHPTVGSTLSSLADALQGISVKIMDLTVVPTDASDDRFNTMLYCFKAMLMRVFVMHMSYPFVGLFFRQEKMVGMLSEGVNKFRLICGLLLPAYEVVNIIVSTTVAFWRPESRISKDVEALAVQLTEREGDLIYEKAEVKKLASFLQQATKDALKVAEERALALREIEKARVAIVKIEKGLQKHDVASSIREEAVLSQY